MSILHARIAPLPQPFLDRARGEGLDALDQPVKRVRAAGGEPCRDVLRRAEPGEELILASFSPFSKAGPYREFGPVFILANDATSAASDALHVGGDSDYLRAQFVVRAYSAEEEILDAAMTDRASAQDVVDGFFARPETAFLHVRFPTYGCFACRLDRPA
ncbi:MAG TPA: DUF1203 domain-containing protein [Thermoanaerobaculia bacterium]|jgi:hypothetical protein